MSPEETKSKKKVKVVDKKDVITRKKRARVTPEVKKAMAQREDISKKRPAFKRQEWFRYKKLGYSWRKPRGMHSKMRTNRYYRPNVASEGYRGPKLARGLHPSGFQEVLVHNKNELEGLDPKVQAVRIGHSVGKKKRIDIIKEANKMKLRVLNPGVSQ